VVSLSQANVAVGVGEGVSDGVSEGDSSTITVGVSVGDFARGGFRVGGAIMRGAENVGVIPGDGVSEGRNSIVGVGVSVGLAVDIAVAGRGKGKEASAVWVNMIEAI
jgi:hypothetical protein